MFPSLAARETYVAEANFASWKQGNVSESSKKQFCFTDANFGSEPYVSQFSKETCAERMFPTQSFLVYSLARPLLSLFPQIVVQ